jgi:glyoxylase-like metal-dependent hydrolase (beta-lactamase superfamily II)
MAGGPRVSVADLGHGVYGIDLFERGLGRRSAAYLVDGGGPLALVETGAASSIEAIRGALRALSLDERRVGHVVVTHVHLDHAGGLGRLLQVWPWARAVVHPAGAPHMIAPDRLEASARQVYGGRYDGLYGRLTPVPADRVVEAQDRGHLVVGDRELVLLHTPGHAAHHLSVEDPAGRGMFTGDSAGIRFARLLPWGVDLVLPTTTPPRFDPPRMAASLRRMAEREPERLLYTHFGAAGDAPRRLQEVADEALAWADLAREAYAEVAEDADPQAAFWAVRSALRRRMEDALRARGVRDVAAAWRAGDLEWELDLDAQGLTAYARFMARSAGA